MSEYPAHEGPPGNLGDALEALGAVVTNYEYDGANADLLETFPNPMPVSLKDYMIASTISIEAPEFTSLCPKTGQPDFAKIIIEYEPIGKCVESKSLKLYLGSFRNVGEFHESCVTRIHTDLWDLLSPRYLKVRGEFTPRGGIPFWPEITRYRQHEDDEVETEGDVGC